MNRTLSMLLTLPLLLTGCSTLGSDCISSSEAQKAFPDFGADEIADAYAEIPVQFLGSDYQEKAKLASERANADITRFDMSPEVETLFLRRSLMANRVAKNTSGTRADLERLLALDVLFPNEGPYLRETLDALSYAGSESPDRDAQPLVRIPPRMSQAAINGYKSGHCVLEFDVTSQGQPENVQVGYCTDKVFRQSSIDSVSKWKYNPAIRDRKAVARTGVETKLVYKIQDSCGNTLPE